MKMITALLLVLNLNTATPRELEALPGIWARSRKENRGIP
jgi:hypothetical protein